MDERLGYWGGARVGRLRRTDLPAVATAIVAATRHLALAWRLEIGGQNLVKVHREDGTIAIYVRSEDWAKILPFLKGGMWPGPVSPADALSRPLFPDVLDLPRRDRLYYEQVLGTLEVLFPTDYPTPTL